MKHRHHPSSTHRALIIAILTIVVLASWSCSLESPRDNRVDLCTLLIIPAAVLAVILLAILGWIPPDRRIDVLLVSLLVLDPPPRLAIAA